MCDIDRKAVEDEKLEAELRLRCHQTAGRIYNSLSIFRDVLDELGKETDPVIKQKVQDFSEELESLKKVTHTAQHDMMAVDQLQKKGGLQEALERLDEIFKAVSDATNGLLRIRLKTHSQFEN
jgi:hypothetical protein